MRILVLLVVLLAVIIWWGRIRVEEERPVRWSLGHPVLVCPLVLTGTDFRPLESRLQESERLLDDWMAEAFRRWTGIVHTPARFSFAPPVAADGIPPLLPAAEAGFLERWRGVSAFLRYFREHDGSFPETRAHATRIYLVVYPHAQAARFRDFHSVGTRRGRVGVVFAPDEPGAWGNTLCLIVHEMLHTAGAQDHRTPEGLIAWPEGYAQPHRVPLHPQDQAEVMALGIPTSPTEEVRVAGLEDITLGRLTAMDIGWMDYTTAE